MPYKDPAKLKAYLEKNKEKLAEQRKARYEKNKEKEVRQVKAWSENNKEKKAQQHKAWYEKNKEKIAERNKEWLQTEQGRKSNRICHWKASGVICENFDNLYDYFINCKNCEQCDVELTVDKRTTTTTRCLDHCHKTGEFRNVLCNSCNVKRK